MWKEWGLKRSSLRSLYIYEYIKNFMDWESCRSRKSSIPSIKRRSRRSFALSRCRESCHTSSRKINSKVSLRSWIIVPSVPCCTLPRSYFRTKMFGRRTERTRSLFKNRFSSGWRWEKICVPSSRSRKVSVDEREISYEEVVKNAVRRPRW